VNTELGQTDLVRRVTVEVVILGGGRRKAVTITITIQREAVDTTTVILLGTVLICILTLDGLCSRERYNKKKKTQHGWVFHSLRAMHSLLDMYQGVTTRIKK
jgi:hypothetical protein